MGEISTVAESDAEPAHVAATRAAYDATADTYAEMVGTAVTAAVEAPLDRALLAAFVELASRTALPVADLGCGTGRVAAFLAGRDLDVVGVDLSPAMLSVARAAHPHIRFEEGRLTEVPMADGGLGAAVCWYSIIHTPPSQLGPVFAELVRVLAPDAPVLIAFQAGDGEVVHRSEVYGRAVSLSSYRHAPDDIVARLTEAGLLVSARAIREAELPHESSAQAFLFARSPA